MKLPILFATVLVAGCTTVESAQRARAEAIEIALARPYGDVVTCLSDKLVGPMGYQPMPIGGGYRYVFPGSLSTIEVEIFESPARIKFASGGGGLGIGKMTETRVRECAGVPS